MLAPASGDGCEAGSLHWRAQAAGLWRLAPRGGRRSLPRTWPLKQEGDTGEGRDQVRSATRLCQMLKAGQKPHAARLHDTEVASVGGCEGAERSKRLCRSLGAEGERLSRGAGRPRAVVVKSPPASAGDTADAGSIRGWGRCPGGQGSPAQHSCLESRAQRSLAATVHGVAQSPD